VPRLAHAAARAKVLELEARHGERRGWVWARLGWSAWAMALEPLARLARAAEAPVGGGTLAAAAAAYAESGWRCDAAAMEALACFRSGPEAALLAQVVRALYEPWLAASARHFQSLVAGDPKAAREAVGGTPAEAETCLLFVDGLRFDLAAKLAALLEERSMKVNLAWRLAALPTVTATGKPAAAGWATGIRGGDGADFTPLVETKSGWKPLTRRCFANGWRRRASRCWIPTRCACRRALRGEAGRRAARLTARGTACRKSWSINCRPRSRRSPGG
jgi:hypothetical protein